MADGQDDGVQLGARLLTVEELAQFLNVSEAWVRKGILDRTLPHKKLGKSIRFTPAQVAEILELGDRPSLHAAGERRRRGSARNRL